MGAVALASLPIDVAKQLRNQLDGEFLIAYHPVGLVAFISRTWSACSLSSLS